MPVIAYHIILTFYGFWLPNDPRGSWSEWVRAWEVARFGPATKTSERRSLARDRHDAAARLEAKKHLARTPVSLDGLQARAVASGFHRFVNRSGLTVYACSILPRHSHLVLGRHRYKVETVASHLKGDATRQLSAEGLHPFADEPYQDGSLPSPWARGLWKCFVFDSDYLKNAIRYVERNPVCEGMKRQKWSFVQPYMEENAEG